MTTTDEMVAAVKSHALKNYTNGGWDIVVECYDTEQIVAIIEDTSPRSWDPDYTPNPCSTIDEAIRLVGEAVRCADEQRFDAQAASGDLEHYGIEEGPDGNLRRKAE